MACPNFVEKTFTGGSKTVKFVNVFFLENFLLYGIHSNYCIAGNFCGVQFSRMVDLYNLWVNFRECEHSHPLCTVQSSFFAGLIFVVRRSSMKTAKIGPLENFPLYGTVLPRKKVHFAHCYIFAHKIHKPA